MLNLKELSERYKDVGLGYIRFGGKSFYEINSETPLQLNSYGGTKGFILNDNNEVELFEFINQDYICRLKGIEITKEEFSSLVEYFNDDELEDEYLSFESTNGSRKWWGKTLDNYYPHPWFPSKEIVAFELVNNLPFNRKGVIEKVIGATNDEGGWIELNTVDGSYDFTVSDCLNSPEFFKPIYQ